MRSTTLALTSALTTGCLQFDPGYRPESFGSQAADMVAAAETIQPVRSPEVAPDPDALIREIEQTMAARMVGFLRDSVAEQCVEAQIGDARLLLSATEYPDSDDRFVDYPRTADGGYLVDSEYVNPNGTAAFPVRNTDPECMIRSTFSRPGYFYFVDSDGDGAVDSQKNTLDEQEVSVPYVQCIALPIEGADDVFYGVMTCTLHQ